METQVSNMFLSI